MAGEAALLPFPFVVVGPGFVAVVIVPWCLVMAVGTGSLIVISVSWGREAPLVVAGPGFVAVVVVPWCLVVAVGTGSLIVISDIAFLFAPVVPSCRARVIFSLAGITVGRQKRTQSV